MKLIVTEKNNVAQNMARLLGSGKGKADKVYSTPVYRCDIDGEEAVIIGLRGHILEPDFATRLEYKKNRGWKGIDSQGNTLAAHLPRNLAKPPYKTKRKPFLEDGIDLKGWKMDALPYLVYAPIEKLPKEKEIIRALKNLAKKADSVVIATDFDREGELIGMDALSMIREANPQVPALRARYSAVTKQEITHAFENLVELDFDLANAGESRQDIDLIWGAVLTRYLTLVKFGGYGNVRSAGRVQTPTLALVVAKERERLAFVPEDYWVVHGSFTQAGQDLDIIHQTARFKTEAEALSVLEHVQGADHGVVAKVEKRRRTVPPPAPFNTTSLMTAASAEGITPGRTMRLAESLYMNGYISYPRVDNTVYPASLDLAQVVETISGNPAYRPHCQKLLSKGALKPTRGKKEETDHPPIYPTGLATPDMLAPAEYKVYNLVARRFLATLSDAAVIEGTKVVIDVAGEPFVAKGDVLVKPGFRAIYPYGSRKDAELPAMDEGERIAFNGARVEAKQTEPPARYSQGRLLQEMERNGLGTKSTRHSIIERLYQVKYVQGDPIEPSALGMAVCDALGSFAPHVTSPGMTADLEEKMDRIAAGEMAKADVVDVSRGLLAEQLGDLMPHSDEVNAALSNAVAADAYVGPCPKCGKDLQLRASQKTRSMFIGCAGWPDCDVTFPLPSGRVESQEQKCPACGMPQVKVTAFRQKPRVMCIDPNCTTNIEPDVVVGACPTCAEQGRDAKLIARRNPRTLKRFIRCENYDECNTGYPLPQYGALEATEEICEDCHAPMVVVRTQRGPWKLCPNFNCPGKERREAEKAQKGAAKDGKRARGARPGRGAKRAAKS